LMYMTCGAAASLTISLAAITASSEDEVIVFSPFFPEYRVFVEHAGAKLVTVPCREEDFQLDFDALEKAINPNTKALIVNSPNNPTGVIIPAKDIERLAALLEQKQAEYGHVIYLIADEPYRKLVWNGEAVPYIPNYYGNSIVCYSFSKAVSLPGERIGYILVSSGMQDAGDVYAAVCGAGRALGFVCAPSLWQRVVAQNQGLTSDVEAYRKNRDLLLASLSRMGYVITPPEGAFYLFVKALEEDAAAFCERAKKYELLLVPSDSFGVKGFVRIAYCVSGETIERSLPAFEKLWEEYQK